MIERYVDEMSRVETLLKKKTIWRGVTNSVAQAIPLIAYAVALCYGGFLIAWGEMHYKDVLK